MILDQWLTRGAAQDPPLDQAAGLRQLKQVDGLPAEPKSSAHQGANNKAGSQQRLAVETADDNSAERSRVKAWPRIVLVSETSGTDVGARFAFHLAKALDACDNSNRESSRQAGQARGRSRAQQGSVSTLLIDLAPAASRLPHVLEDHRAAVDSWSLWEAMANGERFAPCGLEQYPRLAVSAESGLIPHSLQQLPRLYEQLVRGLARPSQPYRWIIMLGLDTVVPLDRACWQAADDVILLSEPQAQDSQRQLAIVGSRLGEPDQQRVVWSLAKQPTGSWLLRHWLSHRWPMRLWSPPWWRTRGEQWPAGWVNRTLPAVAWPASLELSSPRRRARVDRLLSVGAWGIAERLRLSATCEDSDVLVNSAVVSKKIQLSFDDRPIRELTEEFRA